MQHRHVAAYYRQQKLSRRIVQESYRFPGLSTTGTDIQQESTASQSHGVRLRLGHREVLHDCYNMGISFVHPRRAVMGERIDLLTQCRSPGALRSG